MRRSILIFLLLSTFVTFLPIQAQEALTETYADSESRFSFDYPTGWNVSGGGELISLTNQGDAFEISFRLLLGDLDVLESGQGLIQIFGFPQSQLQLDLEAPENELVQAFAREWQITVDTIIAAPTTTEIAGRETLTLAVRSSGLDNLFLLFPYDDENYIFVRLCTNEDELDSFRINLNTILETLTYDTPVRTGIIGADISTAVPGINGIIWQQQQESSWFNPETLASPMAIAVGQDDTIYVLDSAHQNIKIFSADGEFKGAITNTAFTALQGLAIAPDGMLWLTDSFHRVIYEINPQSGEILSTIEVGEPGSGPGEFARNSPDDITIGSDGRLYIFDGQGDFSVNPDGIGRVQVFDAQGVFLYEFPTTPVGTREFNDEVLLAVDDAGRIYAASYDEIRIFDNRGALLQSFTLRDGYDYVSIYGIEIDKDGFPYIAGANDIIYKTDDKGNILNKFGQPQGSGGGTGQEPFQPGEFDDIRGIAIFSNGDTAATSYNLDYAQVVRFAFTP